MSDIAIRAVGIGKRYFRLDSPIARLKHVLGHSPDAADEVWALYPLTFDVRRGESLGIVGRNGSGKSTLLAILAGILTPTTGTAEIAGRVAALLELGSGFNPDFTGRENAYFSGMLHGLSRSDIDRRMPEITAFAEIGDFLDRPVKTYSSGMFVRLAFSVAISVTPDILIIDEALSVGDVFFQQKCFERLRVLRERGTTLVFVSHDSGAVYRFCDRAMLMERGRLVTEGDPKSVLETYEATLIAARDADSFRESALDDISPSVAAASEPDTPSVREVTADEEVIVEDVSIVDTDGRQLDVFVSEQQIAIRIGLWFLRDITDPHVGFKIRNRFGEVVFETNSYCMNRRLGPVSAGSHLIVSFPFRGSLHAGEYTVTIGVAERGYGEGLFERQLVYRHDFAPFRVLRNMESIMWSGVVNLFPDLIVTKS